MESERVKLVVTTPHLDSAEASELARALACRIGSPFTPRRGRSSPRFLREEEANLMVVVKAGEIAFEDGKARHGFHPNMAKHRIVALSSGGRDRLVDAAGVRPGDRVLDCTCGLAADAMVLSHAVGKGGQVCALEASPLLAAMVSCGLAHYHHRNGDLVSAMRRVRVIPESYTTFLKGEADNSWDVVYFDPMFEETIEGTKGLDGVRVLAESGVPDASILAEARRVARRCVAVKDRRPGEYLNAMGIPIVSDVQKVWFGRLDCLGDLG